MKKKIIATTIMGIALMSIFIGLTQIKQTSAYIPGIEYRVEIKAIGLRLAIDGDSYSKGDLYMDDPDGDWPASADKGYEDGIEKEYYAGIFVGYTEKYYNIEDRNVGLFRSYTSMPSKKYYFKLYDEDSGDDKLLWSGYIEVTGLTSGTVTGTSFSKGSTNELAGGNVKIVTTNTLSYTLEFHENIGDEQTIYTWWETFTNALQFEIRVYDVFTGF